MYVDFDSLPTNSRIWIYQSDSSFDPTEIDFINKSLFAYCEEWTAHGQPLKTSFKTAYNHFIILAADEDFNATSGCSIDDSVRAIKRVEAHLGKNFFNRQKVAFLIDGKIELADLGSLKEKFSAGMLNPGVLAFNNVIGSRGQLETDWIVPAAKTWLNRYIPREAIKS